MEKAVLNLYMYELYKSNYLEKNKDKIFIEDELDKDIKEHYNLLYLYDTDLENYGVYLDKLKAIGTEISITGYQYNKTVICNIINKLSNNNGRELLTEYDIAIIDTERVDENTKSITVACANSTKCYKLGININNKNIIKERNYKSIGVNMLPVDNTSIEIEEEYLVNSIGDYLSNNGYTYVKRSKLNELTSYGLDKKFMRKWDKENIVVCANLDIINSFYCNGDCENCEYDCGDDEEFD